MNVTEQERTGSLPVERRSGRDRRQHNVGRLGGDRRRSGDRRPATGSDAADPQFITPWQLPH